MRSRSTDRAAEAADLKVASGQVGTNHGPTSDASGREGTPYQRLLYAIHNDQRWLQDVSLGKRVGFYRFRGELGSGNFSQVKMAVHQLTRETVAVKILDKSKLDAKTRKMLAREIATMETIHHPNIIRLYEVVETYSKIHLVMEYAGGGELFNKITSSGKLSEDDAKVLFRQVVAAVKYMHDHNFIHRDIKAENVFYAGSGLVKLGDFGFSTQLASGSAQLLRTFCGSPPYAAPELFRDDSYLGAPVDAWALGVLLHLVVTAQMPFRAQTVAALKQRILLGQFAPPPVSQPCAYLIEGLLRQTPKDRLSLAAVASSEWLDSVPVLPPPGPYETYILAPTPLPRRGSLLSLGPFEPRKSVDFVRDTILLSPKIDADPWSNGVKDIHVNGDFVNGAYLPSDGIRDSRVDDVVDKNRSPRSTSPFRKQLDGGANKMVIEPFYKDSRLDDERRSSVVAGAATAWTEAEYRAVGLSETEIKARERLGSLGVTPTLLAEHGSRGARSSVIGAYRIAVHRVQRAAVAEECEEPPEEQQPPQEEERTILGRRKSKSATYKTKSGPKVLVRHRSKTCVII